MSPAAAGLLATGLSAVHTDDLETAEAAAKALADRGDDGYDAIMAKQLAASIHAARGAADEATSLMDEAVQMAEAMRPPNGAASPLAMNLHDVRSSRVFAVLVVVAVAAGSMYLGAQARKVFFPSIETRFSEAVAPEAILATDLDGNVRTVSLVGGDAPRLLLVLAVHCPFCEQNMENWHVVLDGIASVVDQGDVLVVSRSSASETREYLRTHGLREKAVVVDPITLTKLGTTGYPATIVPSEENSLLFVWDGVLTREAIEEVLDALGADS